MKMTSTPAMRLACAALIFFAMQAGAAVGEQHAAVNGLPAALKDIPRATGACRDERLTEQGGSAVSAAKPDLSCAIGIAAMQQGLQHPDAIMIDVRARAEYEAYHIGGAIQASLADLRNKPYWRNKTVFLVGNGKAETELYATCAHLKKTYKQVVVLRGGMPAWLAAGNAVMGRAPDPQLLVRLSEAEFWLESQQGDNLVLLAKSEGAMQTELPLAMILPETSTAGIRAILAQRSRAMKGAGLASVVLAVPADFRNQELAKLQQGLAPIPLLVYAGTRSTFRSQLRVQNAVWRAQDSGPKQLACGS